ncbi:uncharacterized protein LOC133556257 [Nerophis ophidion]|uniref:uncharacterized protein LOC133556257 n=1 Tax=Nerophis ophidion TaxID=159077 RepID=UPI002AE0A5C7|nr:uncharacterized protein LOC133556257 [Nerophis ophidion]
MKFLERLVLDQLRPLVSPTLNPLQFAYQPHVGVDDAVIYLLHRAHSHLDGGRGSVRIMVFDFSSVFNTIQTILMSDELFRMVVSSYIVSWITGYLSHRLQFARLGSSHLDTVVSGVGAPQGTVLSPFLFTLYTSDYQYSSRTCHLQKYSNDSAVVTKGQEWDYRTLIADFVEWSQANHLPLNVDKTKELVIDSKKRMTPVEPIKIHGREVAPMGQYKYLGVHLNSRLDCKDNSRMDCKDNSRLDCKDNSRLDCKDNSRAAYKKDMSRLFLLRALRSFNVCLRSFIKI